MSTSVDPLAALLAERELQALISRAARCSDDGDGNALAKMFTADAVLDNGRERVEGLEALQAWATASGMGAHFRHFVTNIVITVESADRAHGEMDLLLLGAADRAWTLVGTMRYRDEYRLTPEGWRFASRYIDVMRPPRVGT